MNQLENLTYNTLELARQEHTKAINNKKIREYSEEQRKQDAERRLREKEYNKLLDNANLINLDNLVDYLEWGHYIHEVVYPLMRFSDLIERLSNPELDKESKIKLELLKLLIENKQYFETIDSNAKCCIVDLRYTSKLDEIPSEYKKILFKEHREVERGFLGRRKEIIVNVRQYSYFIMFYNKTVSELVNSHNIEKRHIKGTKTEALCKISTIVSSAAYDDEY